MSQPESHQARSQRPTRVQRLLEVYPVEGNTRLEAWLAQCAAFWADMRFGDAYLFNTPVTKEDLDSGMV
jgi:predicted Mrr-cat superfamily restriction endonuclease